MLNFISATTKHWKMQHGIGIGIFVLVVLVDAEIGCPDASGNLVRIPNTRYYFVQNINQRGSYVNRTEAAAECQSYNLSLATITNMISMAIVGRNFEPLVTRFHLMDTWYWLDNSYNPSKEGYVFGPNPDASDVMKFTLLHYRPPRPIGIGSHITHFGKHMPDSTVEQCLTLALPLPGLKRQTATGKTFGHNTVMEERPCESRKTRHSLCESKLPACNTNPATAFELSEDKLPYFEDGNWIFGPRLYIVNWQQKQHIGAEDYCKELNLEVFEPQNREKDLIPYIKLFTREITVSQYWTSLKYDITTKQFYDKNGVKVNVRNKIDFTEKDQKRAIGRSGKLENMYCVAMSVSFEMTSQMPCMDPSNPKCAWNFLEYVPANCNNFHGIICQHKDRSNETIHWKKQYISNVDAALVDTAVEPFGYAKNTDCYRSKYKQMFGSPFCPDGYRMLRGNNTDWSKKPSGVTGDLYSYDYLESYWVVDDELFRKDYNSTCTISEPLKDGHIRKLSKVPCTSWHFYVCEKDVKSKARAPFLSFEFDRPKMTWDKGPQGRIYPILRKLKTHV